ncbi:MAG TPA: hypothetical protein VFC02_24115 [Anaerolineales bacterium]|nr:hypothetical protein [Anaerolineales bacterium]
MTDVFLYDPQAEAAQLVVKHLCHTFVAEYTVEPCPTFFCLAQAAVATRGRSGGAPHTMGRHDRWYLFAYPALWAVTVVVVVSAVQVVGRNLE